MGFVQLYGTGEKCDVLKNIKIYPCSWTDQCAQQFKSCFCLEKLRTAAKDLDFPSGAVVHFHHYETSEGKGSHHLKKCRILRKTFSNGGVQSGPKWPKWSKNVPNNLNI